MNILRRLILNNFRWKLFSLLFAIGMWFYCMNVTADVQTTTTIYVPLKVQNDEAFAADSMLLQNKSALLETTVRLKVKGRRADIDNLERNKALQEGFMAYIDLGLIELRYAKDISTPLPTTVFLKKVYGYEVLEQTPSTVNVTLEKYVSQATDVTVTTEGKAAEGFTDLAKEITLDKVVVSGPQTPVSMVSEVRITVNIKGATSGVTTEAEPKAYDFQGNEIKDVQITPSTIKVTIPIYKLAKIPIAKPEYKGEPPAGYEITGIDWNPKYAEIMGIESDIENMREITLMPIEGVNTFTETTDVPYDLRAYLPTNIQIVNGTAQEIVATIYVEKIDKKTITISSDKISINGAVNQVTFNDPGVNVALSGVESAIDETNESSISGFIDVSGLAPGQHNVLVTLNLPPGVKIVGLNPRIKITVAGPAS